MPIGQGGQSPCCTHYLSSRTHLVKLAYKCKSTDSVCPSRSFWCIDTRIAPHPTCSREDLQQQAIDQVIVQSEKCVRTTRIRRRAIAGAAVGEIADARRTDRRRAVATRAARAIALRRQRRTGGVATRAVARVVRFRARAERAGVRARGRTARLDSTHDVERRRLAFR